MTQYTIKYNGWNSAFEDFGEDLVYFESTVYPNDNPDKTFPVILAFKLIQSQAEKMFPGVKHIIHQAKKHLKGWGPQESVFVRELEELGIDLEAVVLKTIETTVDLDGELRRIDNIDASIDDMSGFIEVIEKVVSQRKAEVITYNSLGERLEKVITDEVVNRFPVILNSSSGCILQLRHILTLHIPDMVSDLTKLVREAEEKNKFVIE